MEILEMLLPYLKAFAVGGAFCALGQVFIDYTKLTPARILVSYVVAGVVLGGLGLYQPLIDFAGAGATVPLTGFGALLAKGTREAVLEKGLLGVLSGGFTAAAAGIAAAVFFGLVAALIFRSGDKS
jgi:stage V sporulation protein AE